MPLGIRHIERGNEHAKHTGHAPGMHWECARVDEPAEVFSGKTLPNPSYSCVSVTSARYTCMPSMVACSTNGIFRTLASGSADS